MYLYKEEAHELLESHRKELLAILLNRHSLLQDFFDGDDWSFVIKSQALIECALTEAVIAQINDERIKKMIQVMPLVGDDISKLALAKSLGLVTPGQRRFVRKLATLRNNLAHKVDCISFTFESHITSLDKHDLRNWQESIVWFAESPRDSREIWFQIATKQAKAAVYLATFLLVALLDIDGSLRRGNLKVEIAAKATTKELLKIHGI